MRRIAAFAIAVVASVLLPAQAAPLLVISIDGLHPDYVTQADKYALKIPTLRRFLAEGSHASGVVGVVPTVTYPSHTTMLTGVAPAQHGIVSNTTFDPTGANRDGWYWYAQDITAPTLWFAAKKVGLKTASVNWPVTVGDRNIDILLPEYWRTSTSDDAKLLRALAKPQSLLESYEAELGAFVDGNTETLASDEIRTRFAAKLIREQRPDFIAVHLIALDGIEHHDGPFLASSFATLEALDRMIATLHDAAIAANPASVTAIVSDHGFQATHTAINLRTAFVERGLIKLHPQRERSTPSVQGWEAQVWSAGAVAAIVLRDEKNAGTRERVQQLLTQLQADSRNGIARVLSRAELANAHAFPAAEWLVEFAPGFYSGNELQGELRATATSKGTHGYMPERPQMHASLFVAGAKIRRANLGVIDMRQLAPTFAQIIGASLPSAEQPSLAIFNASAE